MTTPAQELQFKGIPASAGVANASAFVLTQEEVAVPSYQIAPAQVNSEIARFEQAIMETRRQLLGLRAELTRRVGESSGAIFDAHLLVLEDRAIIEETLGFMKESRCNVEQAFYTVAKRYIDAFLKVEDTFIQERVADIKDVSRRLIHNLLGKNLPLTYRMETPSILVARDISPSEAALLESGKVMAVVTEFGGRTGHASIIARALGVPAVVGARGILGAVKTGVPLLVNGGLGEAFIYPSETTLSAHGRDSGVWVRLRENWKSSAKERAKTRDGVCLEVQANVESPDEAPAALDCGAEGIGLFRTEYMFLRQEKFPEEEFQTLSYGKLLEAFSGRTVTIRTLDLGGDKKLGKYFDRNEKNPFMGYRAIRFCLENRTLFKAQLRALLRASVRGNLRIMFPMISGVGELLEAINVLDEAKRELSGLGISYARNIPIGAMIEVPSAALTLDQIARHCSFVSIGTNDLIQYLLACDRVNDRIAYLYEPSHLAVVRTLKQIIDTARSRKLEVSLCGEVASDGVYLPMLVGLGLRKLSLNFRSIPEIKHLARQLKVRDCERMVGEFLRNPQRSLLETLRPKYGELVKS